MGREMCALFFYKRRVKIGTCAYLLTMPKFIVIGGGRSCVTDLKQHETITALDVISNQLPSVSFEIENIRLCNRGPSSSLFIVSNQDRSTFNTGDYS